MTKEQIDYKVRENKLRRRLATKGFQLMRNRAKSNPNNIGGYMILDIRTNFVECGGQCFGGYSLNLDDVENFITQKVIKTSNDKEGKIRENSARHKLARQGFKLMKNRAKSYPHDIGGYMIANISTNAVEYGAGWGGYALTLDDVEIIINKIA